MVEQKDLEEIDDIQSWMEQTLKSELEGIYIKEGYVVPNSLNVVDMSIGTVMSESLNAELNYNVMIQADIYRAKPGDVLKGKIKDKNKFGINIVIEPLDIVMGYVHHQNQDELKEKEIGDELEIVVATTRFQIGDKRQSVVAIWKEDGNAVEYLRG